MNLMKKACLLLTAMLCLLHTFAQKPFTEGVVTYSVKLKSADQSAFTGTYVYTIKGPQIRKELHLSNGYEDVIMLNCATNQAWSLKTVNGARYVIQLSMDDLVKTQAKFSGFTLANEASAPVQAGVPAYKADVLYKSGVRDEVVYTKEWYPTQSLTFSRFPDARFFPLGFNLTEETGAVMQFQAVKIEAQPVENAVFRIPPEYKMIPYDEYKSMRR